jgi:hypothetical protein
VRIEPADPEADSAMRERVARTLVAGMADDLFAQYRAALEQQFGVWINRDNLENRF